MTDRQMFKLVDANTVPSADGGCGCGCGGHEAAEQAPAEHAGCGCGGHDAPAELAPAGHAGCGCGGPEAPPLRPHELAA